jgi:LPS sulfotransferase NodH
LRASVLGPRIREEGIILLRRNLRYNPSMQIRSTNRDMTVQDSATIRNRRIAVLRDSYDDEDALEYFPESDKADAYRCSAPWPELSGCLGILFTSRSGSTFLSRELEKRFAIGTVRESFNLPVLRSRTRNTQLKTPAAAARYSIVQLQEDGWFGFKAGGPGLVVAERCGFVAHYLSRTVFILLLRRDIVAQAVSLAKAKSTTIYHSLQHGRKKPEPAIYSFEEIARATRKIVRGITRVAQYARMTERPYRKAYYEDFADGNFATLDTICRELGVPARTQPPKHAVQDIEKIGDHVNQEWCTLFRKQMNGRVRGLLDDYRVILED